MTDSFGPGECLVSLFQSSAVIHARLIRSEAMLDKFPKISPIIPVRRRGLFESAEWVYELKHDGFRALADGIYFTSDQVAAVLLSDLCL